MKLRELYINETSEEDRALISLSSSIVNYLRSFETKETDFDYDSSELDDDEYQNVDMFTREDLPVKIGTIGQLFDTPLQILDPIKIELQTDYGIRERMRRERDAEVVKKPGQEDIIGLWFGDEKVMVLNSDYLESKKFPSVVTHELRHALDDFKSEFKAGSSEYYSRPKNKSHRKVTNDPYMGNLSYLAEPMEINARFLEVLHQLVPWINKAFSTMESEKIKGFVFDKFKSLMAHYRISDLFPEKEKSKEYKRLIKRGIDFMQKEINYQEKKTGKRTTGSF